MHAESTLWARRNPRSRHWPADSYHLVAVPLTDSRVVLATASLYGRQVDLWDAMSGEPWREPLPNPEEVRALAVVTGADGTNRLAVGDADGTVRIWDLDRAAPTRELRGHSGVVSMAFARTPGGPVLAVSYRLGSVLLWSLDEGGPVRIVRPGDYFPTSNILLTTVDATDGRDRVAFVVHWHSRDENGWIAAGGAKAGCWDPAAGMPDTHLVSREPIVAYEIVATLAAWSDPAGTAWLAWSGHEACDLRTGAVRPLAWRDDFHGAALASFRGPSGTPWLAVAGNGGSVWLWDVVAGAQARPPLVGHVSGVEAAAPFRDSRGTPMLATGDGYTVRVWDLSREPEPGLPPTGHTGKVTVTTPIPAVLSTGDAPALLATLDDGDKTVRMWDQTTGERVGEPTASDLFSPMVWIPTLDHGPAICFREFGSDTLTRRSPTTGQRSRWPASLGRVERTDNAIAVAGSNGRILMAAVINSRWVDSDRKTVRFWDAITGRPLRRRGRPIRLRHRDGVNAVAAFAGPGGTSMIATASQAVIQVWDVATGRRVGVPCLADAWHVVEAMAAFPDSDGTILLAAIDRYWDQPRVLVWNPWTGDVLADRNPGHTTINAIVTLPGQPARLATAGEDGTLRVWDPLSGAVLSTMDIGDAVHDLAVGLGGILFVAGSAGLAAIAVEPDGDCGGSAAPDQ